MTGAAGINAVAEHPEAVSVVTGIVGCAGLYPTVAAIKAGKARPHGRPSKPTARLLRPGAARARGGCGAAWAVSWVFSIPPCAPE